MLYKSITWYVYTLYIQNKKFLLIPSPAQGPYARPYPPHARSKQLSIASNTNDNHSHLIASWRPGSWQRSAAYCLALSYWPYCQGVFIGQVFIGHIVIQKRLVILSSRKDWSYCHAKTIPCFELFAFCMAWQLLVILSYCHGNFSRMHVTAKACFTPIYYIYTINH